METAKVFVNGASQAVRLPKQYRFVDDEVYVKKVGEIVYLLPKTSVWETFLNGLQRFTDDFMADGRDQGTEETRESL